jgi:hypothetical protein
LKQQQRTKIVKKTMSVQDQAEPLVADSTLQSELRLKYSRHWNECVRFANDRHFLKPQQSNERVVESRVPFAEAYLSSSDRAPIFVDPSGPVPADVDVPNEQHGGRSQNSDKNDDDDDEDKVNDVDDKINGATQQSSQPSSSMLPRKRTRSSRTNGHSSDEGGDDDDDDNNERVANGSQKTSQKQTDASVATPTATTTTTTAAAATAAAADSPIPALALVAKGRSSPRRTPTKRDKG